MPSLPITLTSDFGLRDSYVAEMKAAILSVNPEVTIVDISHCVEKYDIRVGAYILASATPYFPKGTAHVVVIDPGVGTQRRPILIQTKCGYYFGPDNGVLSLAAINDGIQHVYEIKNPRLMLPQISNTFHGRDIFAPAAAHLTKGTKPREFGPETSEFVTPAFARRIRKGSSLVGEVLYIDSFGNIVTNFTKDELGRIIVQNDVAIRIKDKELKLKLCRVYAESKSREAFAIIGSHGFLEISMNKESAAKTLNAQIGNNLLLLVD